MLFHLLLRMCHNGIHYLLLRKCNTKLLCAKFATLNYYQPGTQYHVHVIKCASTERPSKCVQGAPSKRIFCCKCNDIQNMWTWEFRDSQQRSWYASFCWGKDIKDKNIRFNTTLTRMQNSENKSYREWIFNQTLVDAFWVFTVEK